MRDLRVSLISSQPPSPPLPPPSQHFLLFIRLVAANLLYFRHVLGSGRFPLHKQGACMCLCSAWMHMQHLGVGQTAQSRNLTLHSRLSLSPVRFGLLFFIYYILDRWLCEKRHSRTVASSLSLWLLYGILHILLSPSAL